jgi:glycerol-3-phosphate acyltransferase PlsX
MVPSVTLPACKAFLDAHPRPNWCWSGTPEALGRGGGLAALHAWCGHRVVAMDDSGRGRAAPRSGFVDARGHQPAQARRGAAPADACVSAGNTGALMALARYTC